VNGADHAATVFTDLPRDLAITDKNLGAEFTIEEIDTVIAALDYRHGSEALVAKSIAKRILPMVRSIAHAQERVLRALRAL
jgi:hypothetical protein